ncbi:hypothetical protein [Streptomyces sp. MH60]|uniref:hypothetical protein n=1 Tax=Streptomyces sp. MH60 TaxID=1940758 RepID=UPI000CED9B1A|nr:hypothetical protein [Streptomyces sp. MH60]PPS86431.1 hypothetical protein BZZ08_03398 [Streptomyces sp. MH60]
MTLGELIAVLEAEDPAKEVARGFTHPHSYRGYYRDLAFEPAGRTTVGEMLADAYAALGETFEGWKGGDFTMGRDTDVWLSYEGCCSDEEITAASLAAMLASMAEAAA